jgi:nucleoside-triphosphatase
MKHIFLTGEIQVGKSTVIQKTLSMMTIKYGGFRTFFGDDRSSPERCLYIGKAGNPFSFDDAHAVARFSGNSPPKVFPERFDDFGEAYIREAAGRSGLIIMDECGNLENHALRFQRAVLDALDDSMPILGVVKLSASGWVDKIRNHPQVELITVDKQNRDNLPLYLQGIWDAT